MEFCDPGALSETFILNRLLYSVLWSWFSSLALTLSAHTGYCQNNENTLVNEGYKVY
jgi:hypothetical protein